MLVPAPRNEPISSLLEAICTDEMCETNPAWAQRRKGLSGVCFAAFTDPHDEGVWCEDMPGPPILARTVHTYIYMYIHDIYTCVYIICIYT